MEAEQPTQHDNDVLLNIIDGVFDEKGAIEYIQRCKREGRITKIKDEVKELERKKNRLADTVKRMSSALEVVKANVFSLHESLWDYAELSCSIPLDSDKSYLKDQVIKVDFMLDGIQSYFSDPATSDMDILHIYTPDWRLIFVPDHGKIEIFMEVPDNRVYPHLPVNYKRMEQAFHCNEDSFSTQHHYYAPSYFPNDEDDHMFMIKRLITDEGVEAVSELLKERNKLQKLASNEESLLFKSIMKAFQRIIDFEF